MKNIGRRSLTVAMSFVVIAGIVALSLVASSQSASASRAPRFCFIQGIAVDGPHLWVSGCVFAYQSVFAPRRSAIVELNTIDGSLVRVIRDRDGGNDGPVGIAVSGSHAWVANGDGNSVTELDANNGDVVRVITAKADRLNSPWQIAADHRHVWVLSGGTVTELDARNGSLVRVISFNAKWWVGVNSVIVSGAHLWLTGGSGLGDVIELNANNGALVRVINAKAGGFNSASSVALRGSHLWVTSDEGPVSRVPLADGDTHLPGGSVTELNANDGLPVRHIAAKSDEFNGTQGIAVSRSRVWVTNGQNGLVTELNAKTGSLVRILPAKAGEYGGPNEALLIGPHVWVVNAAVQVGGSCCDVWAADLSEWNANTGALVRVVK
jgi:hypothetical protein